MRKLFSLLALVLMTAGLGCSSGEALPTAPASVRGEEANGPGSTKGVKPGGAGSGAVTIDSATVN
jgi:hypothetical protein